MPTPPPIKNTFFPFAKSAGNPFPRFPSSSTVSPVFRVANSLVPFPTFRYTRRIMLSVGMTSQILMGRPSSALLSLVMDAIRENKLTADMIFACGPMPMLRAIKKYAEEAGIPAYISLEEHMACGIGACLGCVVKTTKKDPHSHVNNTRICTEGPVFEAQEVEI